MPHIRLAAAGGKPIPRHASARPFWAYYYKHGVALGYDKIGRATTSDRAISAAFRQALTQQYAHVDIFLENEFPIARLTRKQGRIHVQIFKT